MVLLSVCLAALAAFVIVILSVSARHATERLLNTPLSQRWLHEHRSQTGSE
jgi:hypothetical protein